MSIAHDTLRGRIGELVEELVEQLVGAGLSEQGRSSAQRFLEAQLGDERLRPLIEAKLDEPPQETLDRLVLSFDPNLPGVTLTCKN
ncbi:MAG: hypothetical protein JSV65_17430 [Armatimonadota bacterium]|nr:MAG: hypothetical protein JSV65_17430 [Armatimonadota bacterium]